MNKRNTIQKQLVLHTVSRMTDHPTAEEVYRQIIVSFPGISKATVYRNLGGLVTDGLLQKLNIPGAADKYDRSTQAHYHAICNHCGKFFDLTMDRPPRIDLSHSGMKDFVIEECIVLFKGTCKDCEARKGDGDCIDFQDAGDTKIPKTAKIGTNT